MTSLKWLLIAVVAGSGGLLALMYVFQRALLYFPDTARTMPMSASVLVNREETLDIVDDALRSLPEELRHARWLLKEREEYLGQARRDAEDIVEAARVQAERMVERTEVAREARRVAQQVVAHAESDSRRLRHRAGAPRSG